MRWQVGQHGAGDGLGDGLVVAGIEEAAAGGDHLLAVAGVERTLVLYRQQMGVALAGDVEVVAGRATPRAAFAVQRGAIKRAGQGGEGLDTHAVCVGGRAGKGSDQAASLASSRTRLASSSR